MGKKHKERPPLEPVAGPVIDSHAHVAHRTFGEEVPAVLERAFASGIVAMVNIGAGYGEEGIRQVLEVSAGDPRIHPTVGVHPHDAKLLKEDPSLFDRLEAYARTPGVCAWGEVGLDYYYDHSDRDAQDMALREQIRLARRLDLPIIVHDRDAHQDILDVLDAEKAWETGVVIHCFSGDLGYAEACIRRGAMISIPGIVTFPSATDLQEVAARIDGAHLLVETDSPYLAPAPYRGMRNEPMYVHQVVREVARLRGETPEAIAESTAANTRRFFRLP